MTVGTYRHSKYVEVNNRIHRTFFLAGNLTAAKLIVFGASSASLLGKMRRCKVSKIRHIMS